KRFLDREPIHARSLNVLDYVGRALERSHFDVEFGPYGNLVLWFAAVVGTSHVVKHFLISHEQPLSTIPPPDAPHLVRRLVGLYLGRSKGFLPTTTAERLLWSVWLAYVAACMAVGHLTWVMFGRAAVYEKKIYPFYAILSGFAYFVLGSSYWGKLYAVAAA